MPSTTVLYWLPFPHSIDEQVIVVQPASSALQGQQLYHRNQAEGIFMFLSGVTLQQQRWFADVSTGSKTTQAIIFLVMMKKMEKMNQHN